MMHARCAMDRILCFQYPWKLDSVVMDGLVIFVESIRWLGHRWGMRAGRRGLRGAGFTGEFRYWKWHSAWRGWLVLPAAMDRAMLEREARRLAIFVMEY